MYWVGIKDWELRQFHGHEFSTTGVLLTILI